MVAPSTLSRLSAPLAGAVMGLWAAGAAAAADEPKFLRIAAGPVAGPAFATAGMVAQALSAPPGGRPCDRGGACGVPGLIAIAQAVDQARDAAELLAGNRIDAALVPAEIADAVWGDGKGAVTLPATLRSVATLYTEDLHVIARADGPLNQLAQLKGGTVAMVTDAARRPSRLVRSFVDHAGFGTVRPMELGAALRELDDGRVDAVVALMTAPSGQLAEFAKFTPVRLLPVSAEDIPAAARRPTTPVTIAGAQYLGALQARSVGVPTQLLVSSSMSNELAQALTKSLWNAASAKLFLGGPPETREIRLTNALVALHIPLHPGAASFYRELGALPHGVPVGE